MKSIPNVKKHLTLSKGVSSHVCSGVKSQQVKTKHCHSVPETFLQYQKLLRKPLFYFIESLSTIQYHASFQEINQMKATKTLSKFERMPYPPQKRLLKKKRK